MPKPKKQHLKQRKDGRYCCLYHGIQFMGNTEDEALQKREEYKRQEKQESYIRENPTVSQYAERWLPVAKVGLRDKSYNENVTHINHLLSVVGELHMKDVRPSDIKKVYSTSYADVSDSYIKHARSLYVALFGAAVDDGIIRTNPAKADAAKPHKGKTGSHRAAITPDERRLIETVATDHPMHTAAIIMLYAGLRPQEVKALRMEDIDIQNSVIHVRSFVHTFKANAYQESPEGKTRRAVRDVPMFPPVAAAVKGKRGLILSNAGEIASPTAWRRSWESYRNAIERHLNGMQKRWYGRTKEHKALLKDGKPLPPWIPFTVTPYDLRHSFAAWCRDNGTELNTVVRWMGHSNATMVLHIYDEVSSERSENEAKKLNSQVFHMQNDMQAAT